jgi:ATP-binding cassette subfamily E protein 1
VKMCKRIRELASDAYVIVVDHDLAILDAVADYISCMYGEPGCYGIVSLLYSTREGLNMYLNGFIPAENMRIRTETIRFIRPIEETDLPVVDSKSYDTLSLPEFKVDLNTFSLSSIGSTNMTWNRSEIITVLGKNGTGKTTLMRILAGIIPVSNYTPLTISLKPQQINPKFEGTVIELLSDRIRSKFSDPVFVSDVLKPLKIPALYNMKVKELSGGEMQRVGIALCLGKSAELYLLDEPSSNLDVEMRLAVSSAIRKHIKHTTFMGRHVSGFVVEHDIMMGIYLADRVVVLTGNPGRDCSVAMMEKDAGLSLFLRELDLTIRQDIDTTRPRVNKKNSQQDTEQRASGNYYSVSVSREPIPES